MNFIKKLSGILAIAVILFAGCTQNTPVKMKNDKVSFYIASVDTEISRTAVPVSVNWSEYTYTLKAIEGFGTSSAKDETTIYTGKEYSQLSEQIQLNAANYRFTLTAYKGANPILSGVTTVDLSKGSSAAAFVMYPVSGSTGTATITVHIPDDDIIKTVKAGWTTNPCAAFENTTNSKTVALTLGDEERNGTCSFSDLASAVTQYAVFYFYDANGGLVGSYPEALTILGGAVSKSDIVIDSSYYNRFATSVTITKDGGRWLNSTKTVTLVDKNNPSIKYPLKENNAVFTGAVAKSDYYVYVNDVNTNIELGASTTVDYYSVTLEPGNGVNLTVVSGSEDFYGVPVVQKGANFVYKAELKNGYRTPASFTIKQNGSAITGGFNTNITSANVNSKLTITTTGAEAIVYNITYEVGSDGTWQAGAYKPTTFTVEDDVNLPTAVDLRGNGKILDGWKLSSSATTGIAYIAKDTYYGDITLYPIWKDSAGVDTASKVIYANGISLIIKENGSATNIYLDINRNGIIDAGDDTQLVATNGNKDFTGYDLKAGNKAGTPIASDFTFTMTGGTINSITGMGANAANRSVLNISGSAKIGSYTEIKEDDGTSSYINVTGVDLSSIYKEWVVVNGQMSGDYLVVLITQYDYDANVNHYVGQIGNTSWANFKQFKCFKQAGSNDYKSSLLTTKKVDDSTIIRLANPDPIAMPGVTGDDAITGSLTEGFQLGSDRISSECSVFSVSAVGGSFTLPATTLAGGTQYLAQPRDAPKPPATPYDTTLSTTKPYIYLHILSETNQISPEEASEFLAGMTFKRTDPDKPVTIKVNLETVPFAEISAMGEKFSYFDGSFYLGVQKGSSTDWITSYNEAKATTFNGLSGYLINITSDVENQYIHARMGLGKCWTGGARYDTAEDHSDGSFTCYLNETYHVEYDSDTRTSPGAGFRIDSPHYRWQAGPEAGQIFTTGTIPESFEISGTTISYSSYSGKKYYTNNKEYNNKVLSNKEVVVLDANYNIILECTLGNCQTARGSFNISQYYYDLSGYTFTGTPRYIYLKSDFKKTLLGTSDTGNGTYTDRDFLGCYTNWDDTPEPNDSNKGQSEECVHFLEGGLWNDYSWNYDGVKGYIVEFTPYKSDYGEEIATNQSITKEASY